MAVLNTNNNWLIILPAVTVGPLKRTEKLLASVFGISECLRHCDEVQGIHLVLVTVHQHYVVKPFLGHCCPHVVLQSMHC